MSLTDIKTYLHFKYIYLRDALNEELTSWITIIIFNVLEHAVSESRKVQTNVTETNLSDTCQCVVKSTDNRTGTRCFVKATKFTKVIAFA